MRNIAEEITNRILGDLEKGVAPWEKPWEKGRGLPLPVNAATRKPYRGFNIVELWNESARRGFTFPSFVTFNQAKELGGNVKKGEHGTQVIFYKRIPKEKSLRIEVPEEEIETLPEDQTFMVLRTYTVFNLDQVEGLDHLKPKLDPVEPFKALEEAERLLRDSGARIFHTGLDKALYNPAEDHIVLPFKETFKSPEAYYGVALHELTHWTGHESRLNRERGKRYGDRAYAFEELVAEMGAAFLCASVGIPYATRHSDYIGDWIQVLKDHKRAIFSAAAKAQAAMDFILKTNFVKAVA